MSITLEQYSEKAIALFGETEKEKNSFMALVRMVRKEGPISDEALEVFKKEYFK